MGYDDNDISMIPEMLQEKNRRINSTGDIIWHLPREVCLVLTNYKSDCVCTSWGVVESGTLRHLCLSSLVATRFNMVGFYRSELKFKLKGLSKIHSV